MLNYTYKSQSRIKQIDKTYSRLDMLPEIKKVTSQENVFCATWQAVIFRNYGFVPSCDLARLLNCSLETLEQEASLLGLPVLPFNPDWRKKGYITLIRNNWHLLPYEQLCALLDINQEKLDFILQNDDFLSVKLGNFKPYCEKVQYFPLSKEQIEHTKNLATKIKTYLNQDTVAPFDFFDGKGQDVSLVACQNKTRIVHGYLSPCGDAFIEDCSEYMPNKLLEKYAEQGVNGVWFHGVLSSLSPYPFDEKLSENYKIRRQNLKTLIDRCKKYGIKVYLYFNEPRALPENKFGKFSHLIGHRENGYASLCFAQKESREYLYNAVKDLLSDVKDLGGIITITMSENITHCNYRPKTTCPICKNIPPEKSATDVNNVIQKAITDSKSKAELIANLWGWSPYMEWTEKQTLRGVELLDKEISVMCVSEYDLEIEKGGIKSRIIDYSISNPGPSEITKKTLEKAVRTGHKIYAKIQANNSWECSAVPYLPVFDLIFEHLQNLTKIGVQDYMLTWTLGGYPSNMLGLISEYAKNPQSFSLDDWYERQFSSNSKTVKNAVKYFCQAFREYPFSIDGLYFSPKTLGPANLWSLEKEQKQSTMVCYSYDDYKTWINPYPIDVYLLQYEKLIQKWEEGCSMLENCKDEKIEELNVFAKSALCHFKSDYLHTKFSYLKELGDNALAIKETIEKEKANTFDLLNLINKNACVGFEASNHYYYTDRNLIEKLLLMDKLNLAL